MSRRWGFVAAIVLAQAAAPAASDTAGPAPATAPHQVPGPAEGSGPGPALDAPPPDGAVAREGARSGVAPPVRARGPDLPAIRPRVRPAAPDRRCTRDRAHCIALATYVADVCRLIEVSATEAGLDPHFFARLIWQESRFSATAVSPAGAQGIAQFMPETARIEGLDDPFNPAEALFHSARLLSRLAQGYGNIGLAAMAYNAGEGRVDDFLRRGRILPVETRRYVEIITGLDAQTWKSASPEAPDLTIDAAMSFRRACEATAEGHKQVGFTPKAPPRPSWGVLLYAHRDPSITRRAVANLPGHLRAGQELVYIRRRVPGNPVVKMTAQIPRQSQSDARVLCNRIRASGRACMVVRN